jgi:hypothetical protein
MTRFGQVARGGALIIGLIAAPGLGASAEDLPVDLELVLAVDISGSIDPSEARLQREGYVAALRHPRVIEAIKGGMLGRIALTYVEWAGEDNQRTLLDWTVIGDAASAFAFADALAEAPLMSGQWTSLSAAIDYAGPRFESNGFKGVRRVIDISGDGYNNRGRPVEAARDQAVGAGITINGLPIMDDRPNPWGSLPPKDLDRYFRDRVIGGPGAFIVVANDYAAFAQAILSKLLLEIAGQTPARNLHRPVAGSQGSSAVRSRSRAGLMNSFSRPAVRSSSTPISQRRLRYLDADWRCAISASTRLPIRQ